MALLGAPTSYAATATPFSFLGGDFYSGYSGLSGFPAATTAYDYGAYSPYYGSYPYGFGTTLDTSTWAGTVTSAFPTQYQGGIVAAPNAHTVAPTGASVLPTGVLASTTAPSRKVWADGSRRHAGARNPSKY
eukprot:NODE_2651_length_528_cov_2.551122_g2601_i0.p1 GENE.NODE_2651_length_528_cov_2.551122_g2601_i0~~NODE_2651_length_528_cov_2.551122_g2601_i0.p1  ORF type:complete len:132 (-),score=25.78 NODE_2651_length_528_cov_2.551122_g2601_i0:70-465(-)